MARRVQVLVFVSELIPLYPIYALLFADAGLSGGQISVLFGIWSTVGFVLEVPSGALADRVPRRYLLVAAELVRAGGFASWVLQPSFAGFALGFVLWGASGAASSGTWEALLYDELTRYGTSDRYARILGRAESLSAAGALAGSALATPALVLGGYAAAGWASVVVCLVAAWLASRLPAGVPPAVASRPAADAPPDAGGPPGDHGRGDHEPGSHDSGYLATLRAGVREAVRNRVVGRAVLVAVVLSGVTAVEEYFALLADDFALSPAVLPLLLLAPAVGYAAGAEVGGHLGALPSRWTALAVACGVVVFAAGALVGHPLGFLALAVGFGLLGCGIVVSAARLQDALTGPRATVTSVANVGEEIVALAVFGLFGAASGAVPLPVLCALAVLPSLAIACVVTRWMPGPRNNKPDQ